MRIRVPATSANLGPGFDSCGLALSCYLSIEILQPAETWKIQHALGKEIPTDEQNLLIQTARSIQPDLTPQLLKMTSDIPLARGLGSSSSVIVAGIELANRLGKLNLSQQAKVQLATKLEGHPDNVAPAICGSFVVASYIDEKVSYVKHHFPLCDVIAFIPTEQLLTKESRQVLPKTVAYPRAVQASSIANVMIAAVLNGNLPLAGKMMEEDRWHEKYREPLVPHLAAVRQIARANGAYGTFLSGAGPAVIILSPEAQTMKIVDQLDSLPLQASTHVLDIDTEGVQVF